MNATKTLWGQVVLVSIVVLAFVWSGTEWVAWRLAFQSQLRPWFEVFDWPLYQPPAFFWWWFAYDAYARDVFIEGAYIAASGGIAAIIVAIAMSWSIQRVRWSGEIIGRRPAIHCWLARSCTCSTPSRTRRSPASPTSSPTRAVRSRRRRAR
jgi:type IV secretory pathway TraG/TraD family ATPase VirD4